MSIVALQQGSCHSFYGYGISWFSQSELPFLLMLSCLKNTGNINDMHSQSEIRQPCFLIFLLKKKNAVRSNCMRVSGGSFVMSIHMRVAGKCFTVLFLRKNNKQQCLSLIHGYFNYQYLRNWRQENFLQTRCEIYLCSKVITKWFIFQTF